MSWIALQEKLPPYGVAVVLFSSHGTELGYRSHTDKDGEHFKGQWVPHRESNGVDGVTHWFEIPPPPPQHDGDQT